MTSEKVSPVEEPDWQAVAQDYCENVLTVAEICVLYDIHLKQLYERANDEGWPKRTKTRKLSVRQVSKLEAEMPQRLLRALLMKMTELENRMIANTEPASPADCERNARTLKTLVALFEKLKGKGGVKMGVAKGQPSADPAGSAHDVERMRKDLTSRLERLADRT